MSHSGSGVGDQFVKIESDVYDAVSLKKGVSLHNKILASAGQTSKAIHEETFAWHGKQHQLAETLAASEIAYTKIHWQS